MGAGGGFKKSGAGNGGCACIEFMEWSRDWGTSGEVIKSGVKNWEMTILSMIIRLHQYTRLTLQLCSKNIKNLT